MIVLRQKTSRAAKREKFADLHANLLDLVHTVCHGQRSKSKNLMQDSSEYDPLCVHNTDAQTGMIVHQLQNYERVAHERLHELNEIPKQLRSRAKSLDASTDRDIRELCKRAALSIQSFTRLVGVSRRSIADVLNGRALNSSNERRLRESFRLFAALAELVGTGKVGPWLDKPNPAFEGSTPLQVIERGKVIASGV